MTEGRILERFLDGRRAAARIACPRTLIPAPGQYLLAHDPASRDPLAVPVFPAGTCPEGFLAASPLPPGWNPGLALSLRGPLGRGFALPASARRVALAALDVTPAYLLGLIPPAQAQGAALSLVCGDPPDGLPADVEIRPLAALAEVSAWADYLALAVPRASLPGLRERVRSGDQLEVPREAQALVVTPMPCGGLADCGVCSIEVKRGMELACKDGPVFDLK
jgi:dihydroorotate dehydrogenase electron transfer subunit